MGISILGRRGTAIKKMSKTTLKVKCRLGAVRQAYELIIDMKISASVGFFPKDNAALAEPSNLENMSAESSADMWKKDFCLYSVLFSLTFLNKC